MRPTDNIPKLGAYERLAAHAQVANERRKTLSQLVRRTQTMRQFEQVLNTITAQRA